MTSSLSFTTDHAATPSGLPRLLRAARRQNEGRPPVWVMRQAGRYLPEYRRVRERADFLTMVKTPELATEVTLQPIDRFHLDAAIIFSDILVVPAAMGMDLIVEEGTGPYFPSPLRSRADVERLRLPTPEEDIRYTLDAIRMTKRALNGRAPLIGFAGAPWTLASYMIEGAGSKQFHIAKKALFADPGMLHALLARLTAAIGDFLEAQVAAGAELVQLFDSWAGALSPSDYARTALPYVSEIVSRVKASTGVPVTVFAPGAGQSLETLARETGADVLGIDWQTHRGTARAVCQQAGVAYQGNLDPCALYGTPAEVRERTRRMVRELSSPSYIANLGHGILPDTPVENMQAFIETIQESEVGSPTA